MFQANLDVKLPGVDTAHIKFKIPRCLRREQWVVHITGKWFNYGILFFVMLLDMNMWKNQIFYNPLDFGQYTGPDDHIYSVMDEWSLAHYKNETVFSYAWRNSAIDNITGQTYLMADTRSNSRYRGKPFAYKALAFIPSVLVLLMFGFLIYIFGREGTEQFEDKKRRTASERVVGVRISKVDPDLDGTDGTAIEFEEKRPSAAADSRSAIDNYGSTGTSPPPATIYDKENNTGAIAV